MPAHADVYLRTQSRRDPVLRPQLSSSPRHAHHVILVRSVKSWTALWRLSTKRPFPFPVGTSPEAARHRFEQRKRRSTQLYIQGGKDNAHHAVV